MIKGKFISFEGIDGSGKTTQIELLSDFLKRKKIPFFVTSDTQGTDFAKKIKQDIIRQKTSGDSLIKVQTLMLMAARLDVLERVIKPKISQGIWIISDRFLDSGLAYQGYAEKQKDIINNYAKLVDFSLNNFYPDISILLNLSVKIAQARKRNNNIELDAFEENIRYQERLRRGFLKIAAKEKNRISVINGDRQIDEVHQRVINVIRPLVFDYQTQIANTIIKGHIHD